MLNLLESELCRIDAVFQALWYRVNREYKPLPRFGQDKKHPIASPVIVSHLSFNRVGRFRYWPERISWNGE